MPERPDPTAWNRFGKGWKRTLRRPLVDAEVRPLGDGGSWLWAVYDGPTSRLLREGHQPSPELARSCATEALRALQHQTGGPGR